MTGRSLGALSGLPLRFEAGGRISFEGGLPPVTPQPRSLDEMRPVLYNQTATGPEQLYFMYRGLGWPRDVARLEAAGLRYDLTVLVPGLVGGEYVKTAGHYHPFLPGAADGRTFPELYLVVAGRAHYLLQRPVPGDRPASRSGSTGPRGGNLADVVIVEAGPGDLLYVPPGYGHVTINPEPEPLVTVDVVDGSFASVYEPYRERRGAAYYEIEEEGRGYFVANDHYARPPEPRLGRTTAAEALGLRSGVPVYDQLASDPGKFSFLSRPAAEGPLP